MPLSTYGEHAEHAAEALDLLIRSDQIPLLDDHAPNSPVSVLLNAREAVVSAINDRMAEHLSVIAQATDPGTTIPMTLERLDEDPIVELGVAAALLPRLPASQRRSPVDVLGVVPGDPTAAAWVRAGSELLAANHVLDQAEFQSWRHDPAARFALAADTAQVLEAVTILDHRLDEVGLLTGRLEVAGHEIRTPLEARTAARASTRLLTGYVDRLGQQYGEPALNDVAEIKAPMPPEFKEPIQLIRTPGDLAAAQRQLTTFLTPMAEEIRVRQTARQITAMDANAIAFGHVMLLNELRKRLSASPDLNDQLPRLEHLDDLHSDVRHRLTGLSDMTTAPRWNRWLRHQQQEITLALKGGRVAQTTDQQAVDLLTATEGAIGRWAAALAHEAKRKYTNLRVARRLGPGRLQYGRIKKNGPAVQALTALASYQRLVPVSTKLLPTLGRDQLRNSLARAPLGERPPHLRSATRPSGPRGLRR